mmetsp:Transcript_16935/g.20688  ORF Transcript_16935/g.20688 Transcript_16935/m.20688 type:complete len:97 (+) Transcript_16935:2327-2617(+)
MPCRDCHPFIYIYVNVFGSGGEINLRNESGTAQTQKRNSYTNCKRELVAKSCGRGTANKNWVLSNKKKPSTTIRYYNHLLDGKRKIKKVSHHIKNI